MSPAATELSEAIATVSQAFMTTFGRGDAAAIAAFYTQDGQLLPSNSDFVSGTAAIEAFWQSALDLGPQKHQARNAGT